MPTAYEIYQTYLKRPAALIRLFEQALGAQALYDQSSPDQQQRTLDAQAEEIDRLRGQVGYPGQTRPLVARPPLGLNRRSTS